MARMDICCVNLSGGNCPVYNSANVKIGDIEPREFFTWIGNEGSLNAVYFMTPSGAMTIGYIHSVSQAVFTHIHTRSYGSEGIDGVNHVTFYMRNTMNLYNFNGIIVGSVAAGKRVACKTSMSGSSMHYLKSINYAEKRTGGWDKMEDATGTYGFVDTGMRNGASAGSISLYGNW